MDMIACHMTHDLLVARFEAYGIDKTGLNLMHSYLSNRKQRTKINSSYSDCYDIVRGVPRGPILGPLLKEQPFAILLMIIPYIVVKMT